MKIAFNGRVLVLAKCGIPIIVDLIPSNIHILGNPRLILQENTRMFRENSKKYKLKIFYRKL